MAVQALEIAITSLNDDRIRRRAHVLHVNSGESCELILEWTVNGVIRVAGITGRFRRNAMILKMLGGNVTGIVDVKAFAVVLHGMAGNAEASLLGALHVR